MPVVNVDRVPDRRRCRAARILLAMRQPQLAGLAGVGLNTVKRFEAGAVLRNAQAEAIVRALRSTEFP